MVFQSASGTFEQCRMVDNSTNYMGESALRSFAYDDMLCTIAGKKNQSALRFWVHNDTIVLGTQDTRLTYIQEAITFLQKQHIDVVVRNSGGLAVYLDKGVLNISLIFPGEATFSINEGYERMVSLIRHMFPQVQIDTGEIIGSYCPGSYDLSIDGKKFAGISQRRIRNGIAVQIYLCVTGSGSARAIAVKNMYEIAVQDSEPKFDYPQIEPVVMASLNELLNENYTVAQIIERAKTSANALNLHLYEEPLSAEEELLYEAQLERVVDRHNRCLRP